MIGSTSRLRGPLAISMALCLVSMGWTQGRGPEAGSRPKGATETLAESAREGKYTFLLFHRNFDGATQSMRKALEQRVVTAPSPSAIAFVPVTDPSQKDLVVKYGAGRAPMPLLVAVAPNGAITGVFPQRFSQEEFRSAFVTRCMMESVKALQEEKIVFIHVQPKPGAAAPAALDEFRADPLFQKRMEVLSLVSTDGAEKEFLAELQIDPQQVGGGMTVVMAPPGALVGKFNQKASKNDIASAIADAGKCCDDPNCKNHRKAQGKQPQVR